MTTTNIKNTILKGSLIAGTINAIINGVINKISLGDMTEIPLTDELISSRVETVFSGAVPLAVSLAFIITTVAFINFKMPNKPSYFPKVFLLALRNSFFAFGVVVSVAIMVQYFAGTIMVTTLHSAIICGVIAGLIGGAVDFLTKTELLK